MSTVRYWARVGGIPVLLSGDLDFCKGLFTVYQEEAAQAGRALGWGESIALGGFVSVASDPGVAEKFVEPYRFAHAEWFAPFGFPMGLELIGDPDTISRTLETLHRALNFEEFFIWLNQGLAPHERVLENLELFAAKVIPRFR